MKGDDLFYFGNFGRTRCQTPLAQRSYKLAADEMPPGIGPSLFAQLSNDIGNQFEHTGIDKLIGAFNGGVRAQQNNVIIL